MEAVEIDPVNRPAEHRGQIFDQVNPSPLVKCTVRATAKSRSLSNRAAPLASEPKRIAMFISGCPKMTSRSLGWTLTDSRTIVSRVNEASGFLLPNLRGATHMMICVIVQGCAGDICSRLNWEHPKRWEDGS